MVELGGESKSGVMGSVNLKKKKGNLSITSKIYKLNVPSVASSDNPIWGRSKCMKANQMSGWGTMYCTDNRLTELAFSFKRAH